MATAPQSRKLNLTRDQLAQFLTDQQQIRQFEMLFATVDAIQVITGTDFEYQADTAAANANNALAQISALAQDTSVDDAVLNAKVQQALDAIPGLAQALELLALAPSQEIGTIASQNFDNVNITGGLISGLDAPLPVASGGIGVTTAPANQVFAGPTAGAAAAPAFRALVVADIPALPYGTGTVTSVDALTLGTTGTDLSSTVANSTTTPVITLNVPTASATNRGALSSTDWTTFNNKQSTSAPVTYTANFSVAVTDNWIINNKSGSSCTATLPAASSYSGRVLHFQNYQAQTLISASSNVVPLAGGAAGTSILLASSGDSATLVSDGTNWLITQYIPNNILLLE
jgi:hypothetical protein